MTIEELAQKVMDAIEEIVEEPRSDAALTLDTKLSAVGIDSLEVVEMALILEDKLPGLDMDTYMPDLSATIREVAEAIHQRLPG